MTEEEFDSFLRFRPLEKADLLRAETRATRCTALGLALWGRTYEDLQRQLNAPYPDIPAGFDLADFYELQKSVLRITTAWGDLRNSRLFLTIHLSPTFSVGMQQFTAWEARCEIVRRAIEFLEQGL